MRGLDASKLQVPLYLAAIAAGWAAGIARPEASGAFEAALWPALAALLFATFLHVPLWRLKEASRDGRFLLAVLVGNFVVVPVLLRLTQAVWPSDPALRLGVALVLLAPCTDWFLTFNLLGKG
ncbi:MAG: hypothetical protein N2109_13210, partial [Fimbriimonadales bacterium]|nr:hypothetical protein [Fimbriimonadales bacterium]